MTTSESSNAMILEIARGFSGIPCSPRVLHLVSRFLRSGDTSLDQVADLVRIDPGLATRIFEAGSRLCAERNHECGSIEDAINDLGYDAVELIVGEVLHSQVLVHPVGRYGLSAEESWRWSHSTALGAEVLARVVGADGDEAYLTGLLHHCGMLAIDQHLRTAQPTLAFAPRAFPKEFLAAEHALLGFSQADVAEQILLQRGYSKAICDAVRYQFTPASSEGFARQACVLHAARWLRAAVCSGDHTVPAFPEPLYLAPLRLSGLRLAGLVIEVRMRLGEIRNGLDLMDGAGHSRAHA